MNDWDLPVAVTPKVKGIVDETAANFVGVVGGMAADDLMCEALKAADLLIGLGLDPVEIDSPWHAELPIQWILEAENVGGIVPPGTPLVDHAQFLDALLGTQPPATWPAPFREFQQKRREKLHRSLRSPGRDVAGRYRPGAGGGHCRRRRSSRPTSARTSISSASSGPAASRRPSGCPTDCPGWRTD